MHIYTPLQSKLKIR